MVALVDSAVVLLLHHREFNVNDRLFLGRNVLRHVLFSTSQHVRLQPASQRLRLVDQAKMKQDRNICQYV